MLAAAWIQFEVHDWFSHGTNEDEDLGNWRSPRTTTGPSDRWRSRAPVATRLATTDPATPDTFVTADSHWWDGSQIYGSDERFAAAVRAGEDGKLRIDDDGLPPRDLEQLADPTRRGRQLLGRARAPAHPVHARAQRDLRPTAPRVPDWSDDRLYDKARLINAALMAKIHTTEWTPAIIAHPTTQVRDARHLVGDRRRAPAAGGSAISVRASCSAASPARRPTTTASPTRSPRSSSPSTGCTRCSRTSSRSTRWRATSSLEERTFPELGALHVRERLEEIGVANALYSFGIAHPGAISLHNYPRFLQHLERPDGTRLDLAATDILRIRERGVPRYNQFRRLFRLRPAESFEELDRRPRRRPS